MADMTGKILIEDDDIIHNTTEVLETLESFVHPTVVVLTDGGEAKRSTHELVASERRDESSEKLTVSVQRV